MNVETYDARTREHRLTHTMLVHATDRYLSGWGRAAGGSSIAAWACRPEDVDRVRAWVRSRKEMSMVRATAAATFRPPAGAKHVAIYVVDDGHPALGGASC